MSSDQPGHRPTTQPAPRHRADRPGPTRHLRRAAGVGLGAALGAGMLAAAPSASAADRSRQDRIHEGLGIVKNQKGDRYGYGAEGPNRFDCSGLVYYSYHRAGFRHVPRSSSAQARHMNRIAKRDLRKGDFLFFYDGAARAGNVYHVGVFAGWDDGRRVIVHAPRSGERVKRERVWTGHWFAGTLRGL